jgi:hypothetical protein
VKGGRVDKPDTCSHRIDPASVLTDVDPDDPSILMVEFTCLDCGAWGELDGDAHWRRPAALAERKLCTRKGCRWCSGRSYKTPGEGEHHDG